MTHRYDLLVGLGAVLVSAVSLAVAVSANRTQERLLAASTWPYVQYGTGNRADDGSDVISFAIANAGVGPARIKVFQLFYDGKAQASAGKLLNACCKAAGRDLNTVTSSAEGVLKAGETGAILRVALKDNPADIWQLLNTERFKVSVRACYCSVLGECWWVDSAQPDADATPIEVCPTPDSSDRWHG